MAVRCSRAYRTKFCHEACVCRSCYNDARSAASLLTERTARRYGQRDTRKCLHKVLPSTLLRILHALPKGDVPFMYFLPRFVASYELFPLIIHLAIYLLLFPSISIYFSFFKS